MTGVLGKGEGTRTHTHQRPRLEGCPHQPGNTEGGWSPPGAGRAAGIDAPSGAPEGTSASETLSLDFWPPEMGERVSVVWSCFVWPFVTAAPGHDHAGLQCAELQVCLHQQPGCGSRLRSPEEDTEGVSGLQSAHLNPGRLTAQGACPGQREPLSPQDANPLGHLLCTSFPPLARAGTACSLPQAAWHNLWTRGVEGRRRVEPWCPSKGYAHPRRVRSLPGQNSRLSRHRHPCVARQGHTQPMTFWRAGPRVCPVEV